MKANRLISILTAVLVLSIGIASFILSYNALRDFALHNGVTGKLASIWPLLIDASMVVFSLSVVNSYLHSEDTKKQWALVGIYTVATIGFNVLHADDTLQARVVASIAPLSLFFSFEILMSQLKSSVVRSGLTQSIAQLKELFTKTKTEIEQTKTQAQAELVELRTKTETEVAQLKAQSDSELDSAKAELTKVLEEIDQNKTKLEVLKMEVQNLKAEKKQAKFTTISDDTKRNAMEILAQRSDISGEELGKLLGKSGTTGRKLKNELLPVVMDNQNHNGHNGIG